MIFIMDIIIYLKIDSNEKDYNVNIQYSVVYICM